LLRQICHSVASGIFPLNRLSNWIGQNNAIPRLARTQML
jgi:hypothetical protein